MYPFRGAIRDSFAQFYHQRSVTSVRRSFKFKVSLFESEFLSLLAFPARVLVFCFALCFCVPPRLEVVSYTVLISARGQAGFLSTLLSVLTYSILLKTIVLLVLVKL